MFNKQYKFRKNRSIIIIALGFLALALTYSARALLGLVMPIWETDLGWSRSYVSYVAAIALLIMAFVAPVSGLMLDQKGLRFTLLFGMIAVCMSCIVVSIAHSQLMLLIGFGIIGGVGFGVVATHVIAAAAARAYPEKVGLATGIVTSGSTAGQLLIIPLIAILLNFLDWGWGFLFIALSIVCLIPLILLIPKSDSIYVQSSVIKKNETYEIKSDLVKLLSSPAFYLLLLSYVICGYTTSGVIETHFLPYASFCGFLPLPSATAYGVLSAVNLIGMILVGWLADRMNRPMLLAIIYFIRGLSFWLLLNIGSNYESLIIFAVIFGAVDYSTVPVTTSLVVSHLGLRIVGLVMGLLTAGHQIGAALGAALGGYFFDVNSSYDLVWSSSIILTIIAGLLVIIMNDKPIKTVKAGV